MNRYTNVILSAAEIELECSIYHYFVWRITKLQNINSGNKKFSKNSTTTATTRITTTKKDKELIQHLIKTYEKIQDIFETNCKKYIKYDNPKYYTTIPKLCFEYGIITKSKNNNNDSDEDDDSDDDDDDIDDDDDDLVSKDDDDDSDLISNDDDNDDDNDDSDTMKNKKGSRKRKISKKPEIKKDLHKRGRLRTARKSTNTTTTPTPTKSLRRGRSSDNAKNLGNESLSKLQNNNNNGNDTTDSSTKRPKGRPRKDFLRDQPKPAFTETGLPYRKKGRPRKDEDQIYVKRRRYDKPHAIAWEENFQDLKRFYEFYGHTYIRSHHLKAGEFDKDLLGLYRWVAKQREMFRRGTPSLTEERIAKLNSIGFIWSPPAGSVSFEEWYVECLKFKQLHGHLKVPAVDEKLNPDNDDNDDEDDLGDDNEPTEDQRQFRSWVAALRNAYHGTHDEGPLIKLTEDRIQKLNKIGFDWGKPRRPKKLTNNSSNNNNTNTIATTTPKQPKNTTTNLQNATEVSDQNNDETIEEEDGEKK